MVFGVLGGLGGLKGGGRTMRCATTLCAVLAVTGFSMMGESSAQPSVAAVGLELQQRPAAPQKSAPPKATAPAKAPPKTAAPPAAPFHNDIPLKSIPAQNPIAMSEGSVKAGRVVYAKICRACHGLAGKGDGISAPPGSKPANLVDAEWKYGSSDPEIFKTIKGGIKPYDVMEPWGKKISDNDIWNTINFLRDLAKPRPKK
jgi:mono/diheme cytochrome c family protein